MVSLSAIIATLGLLTNSAAVIIGAMIIAPLMSPVIAVSYGLVSGRWNLILGSLLSVVTGTLLTVAIAFLIAQMIAWMLNCIEN